jgi:hypothetical protein
MSGQDGVGVSAGGVGSTATAGTAAGADGADNGAISLSKGAVIGMSVGIGLVIISIGKTVHYHCNCLLANVLISFSMVLLVHGEEETMERSPINPPSLKTTHRSQARTQKVFCKREQKRDPLRQAFQQTATKRLGERPGDSAGEGLVDV